MAKARIIDGKAAAVRLRNRLSGEVAEFTKRHGRPPGLRVVLVGEHPSSQIYVRTKARMAGEVDIDGRLVALPEDISEAHLLDQIGALNADPAVHGILVQLPLPAQIRKKRILDAIDPAKDVDGFHSVDVGRLFSASGGLDPTLLVPCTPLGHDAHKGGGGR